MEARIFCEVGAPEKIVKVNLDNIYTFVPIANFGFNDGAAREFRDYINSGAVDETTIKKRAKSYDPDKIYGLPTYDKAKGHDVWPYRTREEYYEAINR